MKPGPKQACIHCREVRNTAARGLCFPCYRAPEVRGLYPSPHPPICRDLQKPAILPLEPTQALPGTREKVDVLVERASRRESLFHPGDARVNQKQLSFLEKLQEWQKRGPLAHLIEDDLLEEDDP